MLAYFSSCRYIAEIMQARASCLCRVVTIEIFLIDAELCIDIHNSSQPHSKYAEL
jgi:hypothetical protein